MSIEETKNLLKSFYEKNIMKGGKGKKKKKQSKKKSKKQQSKKQSKSAKILNPATGRYVKRTGKIGKQVLSMSPNLYVDKALKNKK